MRGFGIQFKVVGACLQNPSPRDLLAGSDGCLGDDMGAGYSSLATALELRPDFLKIDRSLIRAIDGDPPRLETSAFRAGVQEEG